MLSHLADDEIVDVPGAFRLQRNGQHHVTADAGSFAVGQQVIHRAGNVFAADLVEIPDAGSSFGSNPG